MSAVSVAAQSRERKYMRNTSVLFRSSSGDEPILIVLPTPFSQITYLYGVSHAGGNNERVKKTYVDFIILVFTDALGQGKSGAEEEIDGTAEQTFGERREVFVLISVLVVPAAFTRLGEGVVDRLGVWRGGRGLVDGRSECTCTHVPRLVVPVVRVGILNHKVVGGGRRFLVP